MRSALLSVGGFILIAISQAQQPSAFVNFETAPVHPVAISPDGRTLAVCNLPDGRVELFNLTGSLPSSIGDVPVGVDPVSLRFRTSNELWVANYISRTINIIDVSRRVVVDTLATRDGPADIQFAGSMNMRAFVSCTKENTVQVFDPLTRQVITNLVIDGDRPKAMALSPDRSKLYVAIFESGNGSTILVGTQPDTRSVLTHPSGPYGGQQPVPNDGDELRPPMNVNLYGHEGSLPDSLIVKKNAAGRWMDDNQGDWSEFISGTNAALSGRIPGWDLPDHDLAIIDTATFGVTYATGLMNICMDVAVNPATRRIAVVGTDGANERRFEPNLKGTFLRVNVALVDPDTFTKTVRDLNPHLDYSTPSVPQSVRDLSIGDPRGLVWNASGTRGYVTGMGSRNLIVIGAEGQRVGPAPIELGEGPSGLALDEPRERLYVLNRFSATVSVVDSATMIVLTNIPLFDPTPAAIKIGRKHLYDTRRNSGLGQTACASCHVDARFDRLAWDLGDPRAEMGQIPGSGLPIHPMKGPLATITLQDIIVAPELELELPLHWRGDRANIESFNITFTDLLAADAQLTTNQMQEFKDFLATITFPPNRFMNLDNSVPTNMPLPGFFGVDASGKPDRTPLPNGNAAEGADRFFNESSNGRFALTVGTTCTTCHNHSGGRGAEGDFVQVERETGRFFRPAQLRSIGERLGMDGMTVNSRAGFGLRFDGRSDTLTKFLTDVFQMTNNQAIADFTAFLLAFPSGVAPASAGKQFTVRGPEDYIQISGEIVAHGVKDGLNRSWVYVSDGETIGPIVFQSDRNQEQITLPELLDLASPDNPLTFLVPPPGTGRRLGVDRDGDGILDRTEIDYGFNPSDPLSRPGNHAPRFDGPLNPYHFVHPRMPVEALFSAVDPDPSTQALTFTLEPGAPEGARINSTSGLFTWTPTVEQGDVNFAIRVRVTDDGVPPLIDVTYLYVYVESLRVRDFQWNQPPGTNVIVAGTLHNRTVGGRSYRLQYKNRLEDSTWTNVGDAVSSVGGPVLLPDSTATTRAQRFYRVVMAD